MSQRFFTDYGGGIVGWENDFIIFEYGEVVGFKPAVGAIATDHVQPVFISGLVHNGIIDDHSADVEAVLFFKPQVAIGTAHKLRGKAAQ